jgi:hypothetical protein
MNVFNLINLVAENESSSDYQEIKKHGMSGEQEDIYS